VGQQGDRIGANIRLLGSSLSSQKSVQLFIPWNKLCVYFDKKWVGLFTNSSGHPVFFFSGVLLAGHPVGASTLLLLLNY
jgi:hypothetical protein